jgi:tetratricopeptide (TPR) repeat protein
VATRRWGDAALLGADTWLYWALRGNAVEGLGWLTRIPDDGALDPVERAALHVALAGLRYATGDIPGMVGPAAVAAGCAREAGDDELLAEALTLGGSAAVFLGDSAGAAAQLTEARTIAAATGNRWAEAHAGAAEGQLLLRTGELERGAATVAEAEAVARALGSPFTLATVLNAQASLARVRGDDDTALDLLLEVVALAGSVRTTWNLAYALPELGAFAAERGQAELAAELFGAGAEAASVTAAVPPDPEHAGRGLNAVREELGEEPFRRAWERGRSLRPDDVPGLAARISRAPG